MLYKVIFSPRAQAQLAALYAYTAANSAESIAEEFVGGIVAYCLGLDIFPKRGRLRDDLYPGLRCLAYKRAATIAYTVKDGLGAVVIHGIFYGGQDFESRLSSEPLEE